MSLALGKQADDSNDLLGRMFFNILATFSEFESDFNRRRIREGMKIARGKGRLRGKPQKLSDLHKWGLPKIGRLSPSFCSLTSGSLDKRQCGTLCRRNSSTELIVGPAPTRLPKRSRFAPEFAER